MCVHQSEAVKVCTGQETNFHLLQSDFSQLLGRKLSQEPKILYSISILLSGIKYIIFLKIALPRLIMKKYIYTYTPLHVFLPPIQIIQAVPRKIASMSSISLHNY